MARLLFLDTETTSVDHTTGSVLQISCKFYDNGINTKNFNEMLGTDLPNVDLGALRVNRIPYSTIDSLPQEKFAVKKFVDWVLSLPNSKQDPITIVAHNAAFDTGFIKALLAKYNITGFENVVGYRVLDTQVISRFLNEAGVFKAKSSGLRDTALALGVQFDELKLHDATIDVQLTADVYFAMIDLLKQKPAQGSTFDDLMSLTQDPVGAA